MIAAVVQHGKKNEDRLKLTKIDDILAYYSSRVIEAETKKRKKKEKKAKVGALIPDMQSTKAPHMQPPQPRGE
jgi:hypothetical protein